MSDEENQQMAPGLIQAFNPEEAEEGTLRARFAESLSKNVGVKNSEIS